MEDYRTATKLIPREGYLAIIDLKEAYLLILYVYQTVFFYIWFQFQPDNPNKVTIHEFTALPYVLSVPPMVIIKNNV